MSQSINRRQFVKLVVLAGGASLASAATGCSAQGSGVTASSAASASASEPAAPAESTLTGSFLLISDLHIDDDDPSMGENFASCLAYAATFNPRPDHIVVAGDATNMGFEVEYDELFSIIEASDFSFSDFTFCLGNHDQYMDSETSSRELLMTLRQRFVERCQLPGLYYDKTVAGLHIIVLGPDTDTERADDFSFSDEQLTWLDALLAQDEEAGINSLVVCHGPIPGTITGALEGNWGYRNPLVNYQQLNPILEKYSQLMYLSGHTHIGPNYKQDETTGILHIGDGSVGYGYPAGYDRSSKDSYGCLMRVYADHLEFDSLNCRLGEPIADTVSFAWA